MSLYSQEERSDIYAKIDNIDSSKILEDVRQTLTDQYGELSAGTDAVNDKFNYLLSTNSIVFSVTLILIPRIFQPNCILKDGVSVIFGLVFSLGEILLLVSFISTLLTYRRQAFYRILDEKMFIDMAEFNTDYEMFLKQKIKALVGIINFNHETLEKRKASLNRFIRPIVAAIVMILLSAPFLIAYSNDPSSVVSVVDAIRAVNK